MGAAPTEYGDPGDFRLRLKMKALKGLRLYSSLTVKSTTGVILLLNLLK